MINCPKCGEKTLANAICPYCGYDPNMEDNKKEKPHLKVWQIVITIFVIILTISSSLILPFYLNKNSKGAVNYPIHDYPVIQVDPNIKTYFPNQVIDLNNLKVSFNYQDQNINMIVINEHDYNIPLDLQEFTIYIDNKAYNLINNYLDIEKESQQEVKLAYNDKENCSYIMLEKRESEKVIFQVILKSENA